MPLLLLLALLAGCGEPELTITPFSEPPAPVAAAAGRPNILLILVDDLGFTDLGVTGSEISTPHLDALAREGALLTGLHAMPTCSPSRAALMSGVDPHRAGLGTMAHGVQPGQRGQPGYEGYLNDRVVSIPTLLRDAGYRTYMVGKWDLGMAPGQTPAARGFEHSWALLTGGASHFADSRGLTVFERTVDYLDDNRVVQPPRDFFSTTFYTDQLIRYLEAGAAEAAPFFAYAAYTAPHWPLQAPADYIDRYRGRYDVGYEQLRRQRVERSRELGLFPAAAAAAALPAFVPAWDSLDPLQRQRSARSMEIYAAMVEHLDHEIGRLLDYLRASGQYHNTLIVFASDNGPEGNDVGQLPLSRFWLPLEFDNDLENMGRENSYVWYGAGWASVSAGPFDLYKAFTSEGGIRVPLLVKLPGEQPRPVAADDALTLMDLAATVLAAAGVEHPGAADVTTPPPGGRYRGKPVLPLDGHSRYAAWRGEAAAPPQSPLVMELFGRRMVTIGSYKGRYFPPPFGSGKWQLFDLATDPGETRDLAADQPPVLAQVVALWELYARRNGVVLPEGDGSYAIPPGPPRDRQTR